MSGKRKKLVHAFGEIIGNESKFDRNAKYLFLYKMSMKGRTKGGWIVHVGILN